MMKLIITGVAGFIGSHVAARFLSRGASVIGIDNLSRPGNEHNLQYLERAAGPGKLHFECADVRDWKAILGVFQAHGRDADAVVHEAGQVAVTTSVTDPRFDFEVNALGTFNVLEATRHFAPGAAFLFASTNKVYGGLEHVAVKEEKSRYVYARARNGIAETEPLDFHSPYGCSKGAAEQYVRDYHRIYGLKSVVLRQSCIYGPRQFGMEDQGWVAWFALASLLGKPVTIFGDGKQIRDLLWIDDLVDLYEIAVDHIDVAAGQIFNAGGGAAHTLSILELLTILEIALGRSIEYRFDGWRPGDQRVFVSDCTKAHELLGWHPRVAPADGVRRLLCWAQQAITNVQDVLLRDPVLT